MSLVAQFKREHPVPLEYSWALKFDPKQPRGKGGRWVKGGTVATEGETCEAGEPGECFRNATMWSARHGLKTDRVVHGKVTNAEGKTFDHAWIEREDGIVVDPTTGVSLPKEKYYALLKAKPEAVYTGTEAVQNMIRARHHGPWTPADLGLKWDSSQPRDAKGQWTKTGAQPLMKALGAGFQIVGSVAVRGHSEHDLDIQRVGRFAWVGSAPDAHIVSTLARFGFEYIGQSVLSPEDKLSTSKPYDSGWSETHYFENSNTRQRVEIWSSLEDTQKWDPNQPRDKAGRWAKVSEQVAVFKEKYPIAAKHYPRDTYTEMGSIESHTKDVGREWEKQLTKEELQGISERFGSDVQKLMASAIALHDIGKAEAIEEGAGKEAQHEHTIPILQEVLRKEGFNEKDVALATELLNHDLIGPLFRGYEGFKAKEADVVAKLQEKAQKVGMNVSDFVTLQLAFYQADASAYPYITQYMQQEPSGKWTFSGNKKIAAIEALVRKREYVREPSGTSEGGRFAKVGGFQASNKSTWLKHEGGWNRSSIGEQPYGWEDLPESSDYVPPAVTHQILRMKNIGLWGGSHSGSSAITGAAAREMGIEGYRDLGWKESDPIAQRMLEEIYNDATGSEEPLYHAFQNVSFTDFQPGDTMDLPLLASAGKPETGYATRGAHEHQEGPPTVFVFPKGTRMVAYGKWPTDPKQRGYEEGNAKEFGYVYSEAIVAGRFRVVKTEIKYFGSMHSEKRVAEGTPIPQLYGQVVHLEPIGYFNPATRKWEDHG